jgi:hypothetical protein
MLTRIAPILAVAYCTSVHSPQLGAQMPTRSQDHGLLDAFRAAEHAFTVDPVDGTKNFVNGSPDHAVMVSRDPRRRGGTCLDLAAAARVGLRRRAWRRRLPQRRADAYARRCTTWRGVTSRRRWIGRTLPGLSPLELTWVSCGIDYPHLVEGDAAYLLYGGTFPWDHAPGSLLLAESGGFLGDRRGAGLFADRSGTVRAGRRGVARGRGHHHRVAGADRLGLIGSGLLSARG